MIRKGSKVEKSLIKRRMKNHWERYYSQEASESVVLVSTNQNKFNDGVICTIKDDRMKINLLWVEREARQNNIGRNLMLRAERAAKKAGCNRIILNTIHQMNVLEFYKKLGYTVASRFEDVIWLRKRI